MARVWDDGDKEAVQAEVLEAPEEDSAEAQAEVSEAPAASEEDSAADRVEVSEVPAVLVEYSAMARAEVLDASVASEENSAADRVEVLEVPAVSGGDRVMVPAFVAYKTDSMENRVAGMALAEALEASAEVPAYAYDRRRYPA